MTGRRGVTLIEAVIAVAIIVILMAGVVPAFVDALRINTRSEVRSGAVAAARSVMDSLRADGDWPASAGGDPPVREVEVGRRTFEVQIAHHPYCDASGSCFDGAREVRLEVRYRDEPYYDVTTVYTDLE